MKLSDKEIIKKYSHLKENPIDTYKRLKKEIVPFVERTPEEQELYDMTDWRGAGNTYDHERYLILKKATDTTGNVNEPGLGDVVKTIKDVLRTLNPYV